MIAPPPDENHRAPARRLWPWVLLATLLLAGIVLYFVYAPPLAAAVIT